MQLPIMMNHDTFVVVVLTHFISCEVSFVLLIHNTQQRRHCIIWVRRGALWVRERCQLRGYKKREQSVSASARR